MKMLSGLCRLLCFSNNDHRYITINKESPISRWGSGTPKATYGTVDALVQHHYLLYGTLRCICLSWTLPLCLLLFSPCNFYFLLFGIVGLMHECCPQAPAHGKSKTVRLSTCLSRSISAGANYELPSIPLTTFLPTLVRYSLFDRLTIQLLDVETKRCQISQNCCIRWKIADKNIEVELI